MFLCWCSPCVAGPVWWDDPGGGRPYLHQSRGALRQNRYQHSACAHNNAPIRILRILLSVCYPLIAPINAHTTIPPENVLRLTHSTMCSWPSIWMCIIKSTVSYRYSYPNQLAACAPIKAWKSDMLSSSMIPTKPCEWWAGLAPGGGRTLWRCQRCKSALNEKKRILNQSFNLLGIVGLAGKGRSFWPWLFCLQVSRWRW